MSRQMLTHAGLPDPSAEQLAGFEKEITRRFDFAKMQALMEAAMSEVYTREELGAQTAFYATEVGQAALDQQAGGEKEPAALKEFYATPAGRGVKAKESEMEKQLQKTVTPWLSETMTAISIAASEYAKAQTAVVVKP
ncbi:MAG TPA: hypothetical protein VIO38_17460 [Rariglobus sp.]